MKKQCVVRTYPSEHYPIGDKSPTSNLSEHLAAGWIAVFSNPFYMYGGEKGTEYILEKECPNAEKNDS